MFVSTADLRYAALVATTGPPRSTRERPSKPALSRDAIVEKALPILRSEGLDALNMRRLATELDTGAASLYVYFANRDELDAALFDHIAGLIPLPKPDKRRWKQQLKQIMTDMARVMDEHPGIARVPIANIPTGENALAVTDRMIAVMKLGGLSDKVTAWACDILSLFVTAVSYENNVYRERGDDEEEIVDELAATFGALPAERYPNLVAIMPSLVAGDGDERFEFGCDVLIEGLIAQSRSDAP